MQKQSPPHSCRPSGSLTERSSTKQCPLELTSTSWKMNSGPSFSVPETAGVRPVAFFLFAKTFISGWRASLSELHLMTFRIRCPIAVTGEDSFCSSQDSSIQSQTAELLSCTKENRESPRNPNLSRCRWRESSVLCVVQLYYSRKFY